MPSIRTAVDRLRLLLYWPIHWMRLKHRFRKWQYERAVARARRILRDHEK